MESEGVLRLVYMLRELVRSMCMFAELYATSLTSQKKKVFFPQKTKIQILKMKSENASIYGYILLGVLRFKKLSIWKI